MIAEPRPVILIQSPCLHTPGYISKYASRSRLPSGSFQKYTGIDGMGFVITNSPTWSTTAEPASPCASPAPPNARHDSPPSHTGTSGDDPTNAVHRSVPPDTLQIWISGPTADAIHSKPSGDSGAPVDPTARRADRSTLSIGRRPSLRHDWM